jgi:hypothetical protein
VRLTAVESSLRRHKKLRLARPWGSASGEVSASPDPRARPPPRPRKMDSASPEPRARPPPRPRKMISASPDPRAQPRPRPRPRKVVSASPDPRARPRPRPREKSRPHPTPASASGGFSASPDLGLRPTTPQGYIITLPLASSGYGVTRLASNPGSPRSQVMMAPRVRP